MIRNISRKQITNSEVRRVFTINIEYLHPFHIKILLIKVQVRR